MTFNRENEDIWNSENIPSNFNLEICSNCGTENANNTKVCEICGKNLRKKEDSLYPEEQSASSKTRLYPEGEPINYQKKRQRTKLIENNNPKALPQNELWDLLRKLNPLKTSSKSTIGGTKYNYKKEIKKPINLLGILCLVVIFALWGNLIIGKNEKSITSKLNNQETETTPENPLPKGPSGLFSYGGAPFYASLVANGINSNIEAVYPGFELRYAKPLNQDFSYSNGIRMLIDGELSFAFNGRPLSDQEFQRAKLRGTNLKQVSIAIDGIVFFGNNEMPIAGLNIDQIKAIFEGKVTNWNEIDPKLQNIPIIPVLLNNEDLAMIGLKSIRPDAQYVQNYTQALRKVIATPGAISFSSASLVQGQQLIESYSLADNNLSNYIPPFINGELNSSAIKDGRYPLTRRIYIIYRDDRTSDQQAAQAYIAYLNSAEGQQIIEKSSFVPEGQQIIEKSSFAPLR